MAKNRWWVLLVSTVVVVFAAWMVAKYRHVESPPLVPPPPATNWIPPEPGPAAADPYVHALAITGFFNTGCGGSSCSPVAGELAGVSWHLVTSAPSGVSLPDPLPELEGRVCQTGTWGTPGELCTDPFEIKVGEIDRVPPQHLVIYAQGAVLPGEPVMLYIELMVGAKQLDPTKKPAMESRATAELRI